MSFSAAPLTSPGTQPVRMGGYEILGELGRGGMGVVYKARDLRLKRLVALKMVLAGGHANEAELVRFRTEAEAVARLQHPSIVQIHEVGTQDGLPFFSLEFCAGGSLADHLGGTPLPAGKAAELVETLAQAMEAAHRAGVIHRDLKPANVLLALRNPQPAQAELAESEPALLLERYTPKITDFGLAKKLDEAGGHTATGAVMGTPSYMAPEQAGGNKDIGPACDVYALGAILYELLTGRPPFKGTTPLDTVMQVLSDEPVPPRQLQPMVPRDLESICLKCLEKDWRHRYGGAAALADDLRAYLEGAPIQARPVGALARGVKWARRRPALAALLASSAVALLALVGGGVGLWYSNELQEANRHLKAAVEDARQQHAQAEQLRSVAEQEKATADHQRQRAEAHKGEADRQRARAEEQSRRARRFQYDADMNLAQQAWQESQLPRLKDILDRNRATSEAEADLHGFEWHYLQHLCHSELLLRPMRTITVGNVAFSPDGRRLAWPDQGRLTVWDRAAGKEAFTLQEEAASIQRVAFRPDGRTLATGSSDGRIALWNADDGSLLRTVLARQGSQKQVHDLVFSPDGRRLAAGSADKTARVWDVDSGQEILTLREQGGPVWAVAFSPDGKRLVTTGPNGVAPVHEVESGKELWKLEGHRGSVAALSFSPDGQRLATAGTFDNAIKLWDAANGQPLFTLLGHTSLVRSLSFSPDGRSLASASWDRTIRLWDVVSGKEVGIRRGHTDYLFHAAFSPDGAELASLARDRTVRVWDATSEQEALSLRGHVGAIESVAFSPDGRRLLSFGSGSYGTNLKFWDPESGQEAHPPMQTGGAVTAVAYRPDGKALVIAFGFENVLIEWDLVHGKQLQTYRGHGNSIFGAVYSPDGKCLASWSQDRTARVWDTEKGKLLLTIANPGSSAVAFSPDSRRLALGVADSRGVALVKVWDLASTREVLSLTGPAAAVKGVAYSPDGRYLVSFGSERDMWVWEADSGRPVTVLAGHGSTVNAIAFSPDGRRLASAGGMMDQLATVWDIHTGQELLTLRGHGGDVRCLAFSPDGKQLATGGGDRVIRLWGVRVTADTSAGKAALRQRRLGWHFDQANDAATSGRWFAAAVHLTALLAENPDNTPLITRRGEAYAEQGRWHDADADYRRAAELVSEPSGLDLLRAHVLLQRGDRTSYRRICRTLLDRSLKIEDSNTLVGIARVCVLVPEAVTEPDRVVRLAEKLTAKEPNNPLYRQTLGAALHRAGRSADAVQQIQQGIKTQKKEGNVWDWLFLALAHRRLGHPEEASRWARRAEQWFEAPGRKLTWYQRVEVRLLQEETRSGP